MELGTFYTFVGNFGLVISTLVFFFYLLNQATKLELICILAAWCFFFGVASFGYNLRDRFPERIQTPEELAATEYSICMGQRNNTDAIRRTRLTESKYCENSAIRIKNLATKKIINGK